jgi:hypothetical protein
LGQLLDMAIRVYRRNFILFAAISVVVILPDALLLVVGVSLPTVVLRFISAPFILAAFYLAATQVVFRGPVGPLPILWTAVKRYRNFAGVLAGYLAAALSLLSAPSGIFLIAALGPTACVLAAESGSPSEAFKRQTYLLKGNLGRAVFGCGALFLLTLVLDNVLTIPAIVVVHLIPSSLAALQTFVGELSLIVMTCIATPLMPIGYCLVYVDLRVRKEGFDLDELAKSAADAA